MRGAPLANGLLLLAAVCGTPLANGKPAKGWSVEGMTRFLVLPWSLREPAPLRASACSCSLVVAPIFLKFYRNILWSIVFKKQ